MDCYIQALEGIRYILQIKGYDHWEKWLQKDIDYWIKDKEVKHHLKAIVKILLDSGADVNMQSNEGNTSLIYASSYRYIDIVKLLVDSGADVNAVDNVSGRTALLVTLQSGDIEAVKYLIDKGADVNAKSVNDTIALILASRKGYLGTVKYLVKNGADVHIKSSKGTMDRLY